MMNIHKKKVLGISIALSLLGCPALMAQTNPPITTQSEADQYINNPLQTGNHYFESNNQLDRYNRIDQFAQIRGNEPISIHGNAEGTTNLTLEGNYSSPSMNYRTFANIESNGAGVEVSHINSLWLNMYGTVDENNPDKGWSANLYASHGGTVTIDSSVKKLTLRSNASMIHQGDGLANMIAEDGGTLNIYSPDVNFSIPKPDDSRGRTYTVLARGDQAAVHLGDENHILNEVTISHTEPTYYFLRGEHAIMAKAKDDNDTESTALVSIFAKKLSMPTHWYWGIESEGIQNKPQKHAIVQAGNEAHPIDEINISDTQITGVGAGSNGEVNLYGKKIAITGSKTGIGAYNNGHITIGAGSGENEGLFIDGTGASANSNEPVGINASSGSNSTINVTSGNVIFDHLYAGLFLKSGSVQMTGGINLGTADRPINDVIFRNIRGAAIASEDSNMGTVKIYARTLSIPNQQAINIDRSSSVEIHTSGAAVLGGPSIQVIGNRSSFIEINTDEDHDGALMMEGRVTTTASHSSTELNFHTPDSYFYGNAFDVEGYWGKTNITLKNGANWTLNPTDVQNNLNSRIDMLNLSDTASVNLGGRGTETGAANRYSKLRTSNLSGEGGTFVFRTNLQESADTRTVNGHSDQLLIARGSAYISDSHSSGTHDIMVNDHSKALGEAAHAGYVLLVNDQSENQGAVFKGHADIQDGGLFAKAVEITNENPDASLGYTDVPTTGTNWYLRMTDRDVPGTPSKPTWNAKNNISFARSRYGALWIEQDTLRQRVGELRNHTQDDGVWARIDRGEYSMNGVNGSADYIRYHIGYDKQIGSQKGQKQYIGMAYHHTDTDLNYRHFTDDSDMDADIGTIYYTNLQNKGHYLDIVGKFGRMKGKMKTFGEFPESAKWDSPFYSLSAEYGRKVMYKNDWYIEPQAQLTYSHLGSDSYLTSQGTHAHVDGINSLIFRTGFTVGKKDGQNEYYGKVFWHHEFEGAEDARFHDKNDDSLRDSYDFGGSWVTVGFGGQVGIGKDAYLYGDIDKSFGGDVKKKWAWNVGVRFGF